MTGYSLSSDSQIWNPDVDFSTMWFAIIHSPLDINALQDIPASRMYAIPCHEKYQNYTWTWEVWFEWEYPRPHPITITGDWEPAWETK
ncbi:hypothetical protein [Dipodfec virus UA23Rod_1661]|uniref:Uncharacterized protein n=1 Tax=Dipodfec virus UA23Rod_1661 TaxID=2929254 RepID=A0A976R6R8_9VIRU|nr:hypothetical protein [Dipodfec virus UA23Rod_1661]